MNAPEAFVALGVLSLIGYTVRGFFTLLTRRVEAKYARQSALPSDERLERIEQAVDAIALEVERISEGQRFTAKLLAEGQHRVARAAGSPVDS
jgi:hypothetical protein